MPTSLEIYIFKDRLMSCCVLERMIHNAFQTNSCLYLKLVCAHTHFSFANGRGISRDISFYWIRFSNANVCLDHSLNTHHNIYAFVIYVYELI